MLVRADSEEWFIMLRSNLRAQHKNQNANGIFMYFSLCDFNKKYKVFNMNLYF